MVINIKLPVTDKIDNMGAVFMSEISAFYARTGHMGTRFNYVNNIKE